MLRRSKERFLDKSKEKRNNGAMEKVHFAFLRIFLQVLREFSCEEHRELGLFFKILILELFCNVKQHLYSLFITVNHASFKLGQT